MALQSQFCQLSVDPEGGPRKIVCPRKIARRACATLLLMLRRVAWRACAVHLCVVRLYCIARLYKKTWKRKYG